MSETPSWKIDVKGLSLNEIVNLLKELGGTKHQEVLQELRQELIQRARREGASDATIIRTLTRGVARGLRLDAVAKQWASTLGLTVREFKRIANVK